MKCVYWRNPYGHDMRVYDHETISKPSRPRYEFKGWDKFLKIFYSDDKKFYSGDWDFIVIGNEIICIRHPLVHQYYLVEEP